MGVNWILEVISWAAGGPEYFCISQILEIFSKEYLFSSYLCGNKRLVISW
jgi:hypothetical protein